MKYIIPIIILIIYSLSVLALEETVILKKLETKTIDGHELTLLNSEAGQVHLKIDNEDYVIKRHETGKIGNTEIRLETLGNNILDSKRDYAAFVITDNVNTKNELKKSNNQFYNSEGLIATKQILKKEEKAKNIDLSSEIVEEKPKSTLIKKITGIWNFIKTIFQF